jgi:hypothetical protein
MNDNILKIGLINLAFGIGADDWLSMHTTQEPSVAAIACTVC